MSERTTNRKRECRCDTPAVTIDLENERVVCGSCSRPARTELGGSDDLARAAYRGRHHRAEERVRELTRPLPAAERKKRATAMRRIEARRLSEEEGLSQREIAERLGVSQRTVGLDLSDDLRQSSRERSASWRAANPEKARALNKRYRETNALDIRIAQRERRVSTREATRENNRAYRAANRQRINTQARDGYHRRKKERQESQGVAL